MSSPLRAFIEIQKHVDITVRVSVHMCLVILKQLPGTALLQLLTKRLNEPASIDYMSK